MNRSENLKRNMENILQNLIAYKTVSGDKQAAHDLLDYVATFVAERGMHVKRYDWDGYPSLVATVKAHAKRPKVLLAAHVDVVPASDAMFTLRQSRGRYTGRGVLDMKFALAAYMQIIDELYNEPQDDLRSYDFGLMLTSDEELGGHQGVEKLVNEGYIPEVCVLPDGGDNWQIQTASKGMWLFEISASGRTAHGSRPWLGDNAINKLMPALHEITALFPKHPHPDTNTITLSQINGGEAMNQVPHTASMRIDIRTISSLEHTRIYDEVVRVCHKYQLEHDFITDAAPTSFELDNPLIAPFATYITKHTGVIMQGYHALGASDVRFYVPYGVPCISVYPLGGGIHSDDEWIDIMAFNDFKTITKDYLAEVARQPRTPAQPPLLTRTA